MLLFNVSIIIMYRSLLNVASLSVVNWIKLATIHQALVCQFK